MAPLIPFNKPFFAGKELHYIAQAVTLGNISGDGDFDLLLARIKQRFGVKASVYGVPSLTATSLINVADNYVAIEESLLM